MPGLFKSGFLISFMRIISYSWLSKSIVLLAVIILPAFLNAQITVGNWNFNNTLNGTAGGNNTVSPASLSPSIPSAAYNGGTVYYGENGWTTGTVVNTSMYLQLTLTPTAGYTLNLSSIVMNLRRSTTGSPSGSGPRQWALRSSLDGYTADIATGTLALNSTPAFTVSLNSAYTNLASAITFRLYGYDVYNNSGGLNRFVFDNITVKGLSILPISFTAFNGIFNNNNTVTLNWQAGGIENLDYFEVERSVDGSSFSTIEKIYVQHISPVVFTYTDAYLPSGRGIIYYRIKSAELNGAKVYSDIVKLTASFNTNITINQITGTGGQIIARVSSGDSGPAKLLLSGIDGRLIYQQQAALARGSQDITIPGNRITAGIYVLTLIRNGNTVSRQFVK
jgi:hypothetical protein